MTITGIPKSERIWMRRISQKGEEYYITSNTNRDTYFLYKIENNKAIKIGKAPTPPELEKRYIK